MEKRHQIRLLFVSGTRADFGKIKPLVTKAHNHPGTEVLILVTGMHLDEKYGSTWKEFSKLGLPFVKRRNDLRGKGMDIVTAETIVSVSELVDSWKPTHTIAHGDRTEALATAIASTLNNVPVIHIEGGEVSGTADESMRHAISKLSHFHLVSNESAKKRLTRMGEDPSRISVIGSPELDVMVSESLPTLEEVRDRYRITFPTYGICIFHPVTTEIDLVKNHAENLAKAMVDSGRNFVVIGSNNDLGNEIVKNSMSEIENQERIRMIPSMRFEYYVTLLDNADFIIGNSSSGVREAPFLGIPSIDVGTRQLNRNVSSASITHSDNSYESIISAISSIGEKKYQTDKVFGEGNSADSFLALLRNGFFSNPSSQKYFFEEDWN